MDLTGLPGADLIEEGLAGLARSAETVPSLPVSIGAPRLRLLGLDVPAAIPDAEALLYRRLSADRPDSAPGRYNALVRTLVSFERSAAVRARAA